MNGEGEYLELDRVRSNTKISCDIYCYDVMCVFHITSLPHILCAVGAQNVSQRALPHHVFYIVVLYK